VTLICEALHAPRSSVYAVGTGSAPADRRAARAMSTATRRMRGRSSRRGPTRCGARTQRASTPSARAGADSSGQSITTRPRWWAATSRRSAIAGRRSSRSGKGWRGPLARVERLGYRTPAQARRESLQEAAW